MTSLNQSPVPLEEVPVKFYLRTVVVEMIEIIEKPRLEQISEITWSDLPW